MDRLLCRPSGAEKSVAHCTQHSRAGLVSFAPPALGCVRGHRFARLALIGMGKLSHSNCKSNGQSRNRQGAVRYSEPNMSSAAATAVETVYRAEWGRIVATLIRLIGDFDLAEECAQEAFAAAVDQWRATGVPALPRAWIIQTARNKAIDRIGRQGRYAEKLALYGNSEIGTESQQPNYDSGEIPDDRLRLMFTCCHPALALEAQVALTLRTLCGLETDEIARAFLVPPTTMAQRLVRAKQKIREAG